MSSFVQRVEMTDKTNVTLELLPIPTSHASWFNLTCNMGAGRSVNSNLSVGVYPRCVIGFQCGSEDSLPKLYSEPSKPCSVLTRSSLAELMLCKGYNEVRTPACAFSFMTYLAAVVEKLIP
jgi:hypothetical protein